jgi:hypothetical protein
MNRSDRRVAVGEANIRGSHRIGGGVSDYAGRNGDLQRYVVFGEQAHPGSWDSGCVGRESTGCARFGDGRDMPIGPSWLCARVRRGVCGRASGKQSGVSGAIAGFEPDASGFVESSGICHELSISVWHRRLRQLCAGTASNACGSDGGAATRMKFGFPQSPNPHPENRRMRHPARGLGEVWAAAHRQECLCYCGRFCSASCCV